MSTPSPNVPDPPKRYNKLNDVLEQLMQAFPGSQIIDPITWEPTNHPLNKLNAKTAAPKRKRRSKRAPGEGQGKLL